MSKTMFSTATDNISAFLDTVNVARERSPSDGGPERRNNNLSVRDETAEKYILELLRDRQLSVADVLQSCEVLQLAEPEILSAIESLKNTEMIEVVNASGEERLQLSSFAANALSFFAVR